VEWGSARGVLRTKSPIFVGALEAPTRGVAKHLEIVLLSWYTSMESIYNTIMNIAVLMRLVISISPSDFID